jgi:hypothetical protein
MSLASTVSGLFKWRQFEPEVILLAVGWYLRFSLSYRDVEELLTERGIEVDHVTLWRWVQRYAPELEKRLRKRLKPTNDSWPSGRNLRPGQGSVALPVPGGGLHRLGPSIFFCRSSKMQRLRNGFWPKRWAEKITLSLA